MVGLCLVHEAIKKANEAEAEHLSNCKRLRKVPIEQTEEKDIKDIQQPLREIKEEDDLSEAVVPSTNGFGVSDAKQFPTDASSKPPIASNTVPMARRARRRHVSGPPSGLTLSKLTVADRAWLQNHPLYIKIHQRGYPIPLGDQDILALKAFTPKEMGGDADFSFSWLQRCGQRWRYLGNPFGNDRKTQRLNVVYNYKCLINLNLMLKYA